MSCIHDFEMKPLEQPWKVIVQNCDALKEKKKTKQRNVSINLHNIQFNQNICQLDNMWKTQFLVTK